MLSLRVLCLEAVCRMMIMEYLECVTVRIIIYRKRRRNLGSRSWYLHALGQASFLFWIVS